LAPAAVCWVAASGITGGRSPGRAFGPVVGTSAGTLGPAGADDVDAAVLGGADAELVRPGELLPLVQPGTRSSTKTTNPPIRDTSHMVAAN
jgi:hypothetical protein